MLPTPGLLSPQPFLRLITGLILLFMILLCRLTSSASGIHYVFFRLGSGRVRRLEGVVGSNLCSPAQRVLEVGVGGGCAGVAGKSERADL